ncbi:DinB family protein [Streptomyces sp. cmx-18-6]|uniref:DinB family protein n=1 Tax=Streptomyces sp. cmx-18-6 TaxID=2790930 RepID=UPI00397EDB7C
MEPHRTDVSQQGERQDLLELLSDQRTNFLYTLDGLTDEQARTRTTASELTLGGLVKHLGDVQRSWLAVIDGSAPAEVSGSELDPDANRMTEEESLDALRAAFAEAAETLDRAIRREPDLDREVTLPRYPWSPPEPITWTVRHILLHALREICHHSGHADILRESLDGASTTLRMMEASVRGG